MDLIDGIIIIGVGIVMITLGIKLPNLFKGLYESVKDEKSIIKMGLTFKVFGTATLIMGIIMTIRDL